MKLTDTLNWRYATKRYLDKKVPKEKVNEILEAIRLSASSAGIQPYKVVLVENEELRNKLQSASFNPQMSQASHLLVFAAYEQMKQEHIDDYMALASKERAVPAESLAPFKAKLETSFLKLSKEETLAWASRQAYIALGTALIAAAELQVDSTPMEGFNGAEFDALLGLKERGLRSVVVMALGYRDEANDFLAKQKKVRKPLNELVIEA